MPVSPDILFSLTGDVRRNSRALRQLNALADAGFAVHVLTFEGDIPVDLGPRVSFQNLAHPRGRGPRFFYGVHDRFHRAARVVRAGVYHASDLFTLPAMHRAARSHGARLTYDARELYPHVGAIASKPWSRAFWYAVERRHVRQAAAVFTVSDPIADWMAGHYGIPRPLLIPNVPPRQKVPRTDLLRRMTGAGEKAVILLYQGYLKPGRGCERLLEVVREVSNVTLVYLGEGPLQSTLTASIKGYGIADRVHILPMVPPAQLLTVTASADIGACLIEDLSLSLRYALPNKLFEYAMAGLPVLASDLPEIRSVVEKFDIGCTLPANDHAALVNALRRMASPADLERWAANTSNLTEVYNWETASIPFVDVYRSLLRS